ncbi:MAG TPA: type IV pilus twitching motility protein PilT [Terriglobia bacterium]
MDLDELLKTVCEGKASDLHLKVGNVAHMRVDGELRPVPKSQTLSFEDVEKIAAVVMNKRQRDAFEKVNQVDFAYSVSGLGRFRVNVFRQRGTVAMALRVIPESVDSLEKLQLPKVIETLADERRGLVLVTGVAGSGKSTTLAAMIDRVNSTRHAHIITLEDPIEFLHRDKAAIVDQREVGEDIPDFQSGLRAALRQDPDVILVGEMRDSETIQTVLMAAETGHTVFSTLHTLDAAETIQRVISVFAPHDQQQIRLQLASTLKGVAALRLLKRKGSDGRVPAVEVLVATNYIHDCVVNPDKTPLIHQAIAAGFSQYGMQTFDQSLFSLYSEGFIDLEDALPQASKPDEFRLRVAGIHSE